MVCTCFDKKNSGDAATLAQSENLIRKIYLLLKNENMSNKELAEELHKPIQKKKSIIVSISTIKYNYKYNKVQV